ncbi:MAG TPA: GTP-binding protein [Acidimicrobiales bacterium]|nr:GTP-binding protein [Acidimicrobiales bacterium]
MGKIPVTVIGGYLGSGKTTLINNVISEDHGLKLALLINDFGDINIDAALIESQDGDVLSLSNGCVCCTLTDDFSKAMEKIKSSSENFDRVIIEMSGIGEPFKVASYVDEMNYFLDGVVVLLDVTKIKDWAENKYVGPLIIRQIESADLLVGTHLDLVEGLKVKEIGTWLENFTDSVFLQTPISLGLLVGLEANSKIVNDTDFDHNHLTITALTDALVSKNFLEGWLSRRPKEVVRVKGIVEIQGENEKLLVVQSCGSRASVVPFSSNQQEKINAIVVIATKGINRKAIEAWLYEIGRPEHQDHDH